MNAIGRVYEVTDAARFILSYLTNPTNPEQTTFKPIGSARIHIGSVLPLSGGFFPSFSAKGETDANGMFNVDCSNLPVSVPAHLVAYRLLQVVHVVGMSVPIYGPIYRSQAFQLSRVDNDPRSIYVIPKQIPDAQGLSQAQISAQVNQAKGNMANVDSLSAFIGDSGINVVGKGRGATITFRIALSPSTSDDLDLFVSHKLEEFDIDLPGPDFITTICVDEGDIEKEVRKGVRAIVASGNQQIKQQMIDETVRTTGVASALVTSLLNTRVSMTFSKIRYPVIETKNLGFMKIKLRAIVPDPCLGVPKILY